MKLENRDPFPRITAPSVEGEDETTLPDELAGGWSVVVFYRGVW